MLLKGCNVLQSILKGPLCSIMLLQVCFIIPEISYSEKIGYPFLRKNFVAPPFSRALALVINIGAC